MAAGKSRRRLGRGYVEAQLFRGILGVHLWGRIGDVDALADETEEFRIDG